MGTAARNSKIIINASDMSAYLRSWDSSFTQVLEDSTAFGASVLAKKWTPTLSEQVDVFGGFQNATADTGINAVVRAAKTNGTRSIVVVYPTGETIGASGIAIEGDLSSRGLPTEVASVLRIEAEFRSSVGEEDVVSLHATEEETLDGNGDTVDNSAATTDGGAAYLWVPDVTTDITVTIRHSSDNFAADDTLLASFTQVTTDRSWQRVAITGSIKQYVRAVWDLTGDATFGVALHRR